MKPDGAKRIWERYVVKNKLRYTKLYDDGDNKRFITSSTFTHCIKVKKLEYVVKVRVCD